MGWEHFHHGADIGVRGTATDKDHAFSEAAVALTAVITEPGTVSTRQKVHISCSAPDDEILFIDWLNAIVYEMSERQMLFGRFDVTISELNLEADVWGEPVDREKHHPAVEIKGATFTELRVAKDGDGIWTAQCVVDV